MKISIFEIIVVVVCLIIVLFIFCSIYSSIDTIKSIIQKRKHKKIIKKLKEEAEYGKICADILRNKIIESKEEEKK